MKEMKKYITPVIKVVSFEVEHGFAGSVEKYNLFHPHENQDHYNDQNQEKWDGEAGSLFDRWE